MGAPELPLLHGSPRSVAVLGGALVTLAVSESPPFAGWLTRPLPGPYPRACFSCGICLRCTSWLWIASSGTSSSTPAFWGVLFSSGGPLSALASREAWPRPAILGYLFSRADAGDSVLRIFHVCGWCDLSARRCGPRIGNISALTDRPWRRDDVGDRDGGLPGTARAYWRRLLYPRREWVIPGINNRKSRSLPVEISTRQTPSVGFDLLRVPLVGPLLRWRYTARAPVSVSAVGGARRRGRTQWATGTAEPGWRTPLDALARVCRSQSAACRQCVLHGLSVDVAPRRGRRFVSPRWEWPCRLESKWLAIGLLILFFWAYEAFDLWLSPWWTAWIVVGYFVAAFAVDMLFRGAAFCKYVAPWGSFNSCSRSCLRGKYAFAILGFARIAAPRNACAAAATSAGARCN